MVEINYTKWGLANRFSEPDVIELNEALKGDQQLHDAILDHELGHKEKNTFKQDFIHDLSPINKLSQKKLVIFMIKHPRTWIQVLPIYWSKTRKQFIYDLNMLIIYGFVFGMIVLFFFIIR